MPSHIGITGTDRADSAARKSYTIKKGNTSDTLHINIPYTDVKPTINKHIRVVESMEPLLKQLTVQN